jgi:hypothetical protein
MKRIYFDIETGPAPNAVDQFNPESVLVGNLKDGDKIKAKIEDARNRFVADSALSPLTGMVLAAGFLHQDDLQPSIYVGDEATVVGHALDIISEAIYRRDLVIGFCSLTFDLPYLVKRAWRLGIGAKLNILRESRYWSPCLIDLRDKWQMGDRQAPGSLDTIGRFLGVGQKSGSGADFADLLKRDPDAAQEYLANDLRLTRAIGERLLA